MRPTKLLIQGLVSVCTACLKQPRMFVRWVSSFPAFARGLGVDDRWARRPPSDEPEAPPSSPLWDYFSQHEEGPGIWKWTHYFEAYERHLSRFRGKETHVLEIGIYSGGSLGMWQWYFGDRCHIYGVDIEEDCKVYESDRVRVFIGDQQSPSFWQKFRAQTPKMHVVIDDGGHKPEQQMVTLEQMLPHMPPGSVYCCEDIHGISNRFAAFASGLVHGLNATSKSLNGGLEFASTSLQQAVHSIHFYPYLCVIEKHDRPPTRLDAFKRGTEWRPWKR